MDKQRPQEPIKTSETQEECMSSQNSDVVYTLIAVVFWIGVVVGISFINPWLAIFPLMFVTKYVFN